jgi:hypothetical protein
MHASLIAPTDCRIDWHHAAVIGQSFLFTRCCEREAHLTNSRDIASNQFAEWPDVREKRCFPLTKPEVIRHKGVGRLAARVFGKFREEFFPLGCFESRI